MMRNILIFITALACAPLGLTQTPPAPPTQAQAKQPDQLLSEGIYSIIGFLRQSGATDLNKILFFIDQQITQYFDFKRMTQLAAGPFGRQLNAAQMENLSKKIHTLFVESLSTNLVNYAFTNREIRFLPPQRSRFANEVTVQAIITHPRGFPSRLSFRFHPTGSGWKIYDVAANGQSAVMFYRKKIARMAMRDGIEAFSLPASQPAQ